jgi:hypothetical protein
MRDQVSAKRARSLFDYAPETGIVRWKVERRSGRGAGRVMASPGDRAGYVDGGGYVVIMYAGRNYRRSRLAWVIMTGRWPKAEIDHIDGARQNDRWRNLREASRGQNLCNRSKPKNNTSGFKGVCRHLKGEKWRAQIGVASKRISLGCYETPQAAHRAYVRAAKKLHGEFYNPGSRL